jgi:hypothetical protein
MASKITKLTAVFSSPSPAPTPIIKSQTIAKLESATGSQVNVYVSEIPVIEHSPSLSQIDGEINNEAETEVVEEMKINLDGVVSPLVGADLVTDGESALAQDLSRQSVSLDGDSILALSAMPPPPTLSRFSVMQLHSGNNRLSNMPVQVDGVTPEDEARFQELMDRLTLTTPGKSSSMEEPTLLPTPTPSTAASPPLSPRSEESPSIQIDSPSLVASTNSNAQQTQRKMQITKRNFPSRLATSAPIGSPKPESVLCFKKISSRIGTYVSESGMRILDFVASPFAIGRFKHPERVFPVVLLPAGPQLIRSDLDYTRWCMICDGTSTPTTLMQAVLQMNPEGADNYILRICGTSEYLLDNERPLVDYARLRLAIRDRRRIELLCEDRAGMRCTQALQNHFDAIHATPVPPPNLDPFFGLDSLERDTTDVNFMEGPLTIKIHALEHFNFDLLKEYLDCNESTFNGMKSQFELTGNPGPDMTFSVEFALVFNNEIIGEQIKSQAKPSPIWVEQLKFPFTWSQLPREIRVMVKVLFRKSKTSRPFIIGEVCLNLFDVFGVLTTGKQAAPIHPGSFQGKHSYTTTSTITSVYKSKNMPFLHYEIFELKSGLAMLHERSPLRGLPKRSNASPIQLLLPEKSEESELARLLRIHPLYKLNDKEKSEVWKFRYYVHFSSPHSLPLLIKCMNWMNPKMVEELHRLISQWDPFDPLVALELLDCDVSDTVVRTFAVDCLHAFSDEELVMYMLQLIQALIFEPFHDSALARFLMERALRNRTQVGNSLYWHLVSVEGDINVQERIQMMTESYLVASGSEHGGRIVSQTKLLHHFRTLSAKASKLDPKAKLALLEAELQPDLFSVGGEAPESSVSPPLSPASPRQQQPINASSQSTNSTISTPLAISPRTHGRGENDSSSSPVVVSASAPGTPPPSKLAPSGKLDNSGGSKVSAVSPRSGRTWTLGKGSVQSPSNVTSSSPPTSNTSTIVSAPTNTVVTSVDFTNPIPQSFAFLNLPLDPSLCTRRIIKSKCKFMVSSAAPMWLVFDNADPLAPPSPTIFKSGDDLRQDILILQLLTLMDTIWQRDGLELHVSAYGCVATGRGEGFIEVVQNATTTGKIQKGFGASGAFRKTPLASWLQQQHAGKPDMHEEAIDNFVSSCAAYCIASYVLGLGDRHADNIMVTTMGNLFHIDFAHILGNIMMFGAYKRERAPFVLTPEFVFVMGDTKSPRYARFVDLCLKGYNSLRRHTYLFIRLFKMMLSAGLPQFTDLGELSYLYKSLSLGFSEQGAADKFAKLIDESRKTTTTLVNNFFHNLATGGGGTTGNSVRQLTASSSSRSLTNSKSSNVSSSPASPTTKSKKTPAR